MEKNRFLELEFVTLRKEIEEANTRAFQLMLGGVTVIPGIQYLARTYNLDAITLGLPLLVLVIAMLFLAQNLTVMRAGRYIREKIEPFIPEVLGWETWLENEDADRGRRTYDKLITNAFYLLYLLYYCFSIYLATIAARRLFNDTIALIILIVHITIGIGVVILILLNARTSTSTKPAGLPIRKRSRK